MTGVHWPYVFELVVPGIRHALVQERCINAMSEAEVDERYAVASQDIDAANILASLGWQNGGYGGAGLI